MVSYRLGKFAKIGLGLGAVGSGALITAYILTADDQYTKVSKQASKPLESIR